MNVIATLFNRQNLFDLPATGAAGPQHPRELYRLLYAYYLNNGLYEDLQLMLSNEGVWKEALRGLRNPANRVVEFHVSHLWPGQLPEALPLKADNQRIIEPVHQLWQWSNWSAQKQVGARRFGNFGDLFIKVVQKNNAAGQPVSVYLQLLDPQYVSDFDKDERGFVTYIRVDVPRTRRTEDDIETYTHTEVWDKAGQSYRVWEHDKTAGHRLRSTGDAQNRGPAGDLRD